MFLLGVNSTLVLKPQVLTKLLPSSRFLCLTSIKIMKIVYPNDKSRMHIKETSLFLVISLMTILDGLYINYELIAPVKLFRYSLLLIIAVLIIFKLPTVLKEWKLKSKGSSLIVLHVFFIIYGLLLSAISGGSILFEFDSRMHLFVILSVLYTISIVQHLQIDDSTFYEGGLESQRNKKYLRNLAHKLLGLFFVISVPLLFITNALKLTPLPHFYFNHDESSTYSQGTTAFFAIAAIYFICFAMSVCTPSKRILLLSITFVMMLLSALGAARGDFLVGVLVIFLITVKHFSLRGFLLLTLTLSATGLYVIYQDILDFSDLLLFQRLEGVASGEDFGMRDLLLLQSFQLLDKESICNVVGCGFNYFQLFYNYEFGLYPHNSLAEFAVTFGLLVTIPLYSLAFLGALSGYFTKHGKTFLYYVLLFWLGLSFKSGTIYSITVIPAVLYFSWLGMQCVKSSLNLLHKV